MEKSIASNSKLKYILLSILFLILFIFTALFISKPISAYADDDTPQIGQIMNLNTYSANETDESSNETAGYLYWAASEDRCGVLYYVIDSDGWCRAQGVLLDRAGKEEFGYYASSATREILDTRTTTNNAPGVSEAVNNIKYVEGVSTVYYSDGWQAKGSDAMAYLMEDSGVTKFIKGVPIDLPNWAWYVYQTGESGKKALEELSKPDTKWQVLVEPVSVNYLYTNDTFTNNTTNSIKPSMTWEAGSPMPEGATNSNGWTPEIYLATAYKLIYESNRVGGEGGGTYTYKFYNTQLPYSLCLDHEIDMPAWTGAISMGTNHLDGVPAGSIHRIPNYSDISGQGVSIASIDVTGFSLPPIHTYWEPNGTPGNTEPPSDDNGTSGECVIKKLYYTQIISSDGTILTEATDYHHFEQSGTTNYISIDTEEDYEIEGWKASTSKSSLTTKEQFTSISASRNGSSSETITLDADTGEKYLYVLLKKTEIDDTPHEDYDFRLEQSQITKRVTFLEGMGPANTPDLITHNFTWTAPAPTITSCTAHGGYGHHLKHDKEWDTEPVEGVPHKHADHSDEISYYKCGYTYSCPAGCKAIHKHHTHKDDECIGYKKFTCTTPLCPSGCTKKHTHHFAHHTDRCYTVCNKVWDTAPVKR